MPEVGGFPTYSSLYRAMPEVGATKMADKHGAVAICHKLYIHINNVGLKKLSVLSFLDQFLKLKTDLFLNKKLNKTCHRDRIARLTAPCLSHKKL